MPRRRRLKKTLEIARRRIDDPTYDHVDHYYQVSYKADNPALPGNSSDDYVYLGLQGRSGASLAPPSETNENEPRERAWSHASARNIPEQTSSAYTDLEIGTDQNRSPYTPLKYPKGNRPKSFHEGSNVRQVSHEGRERSNTTGILSNKLTWRKIGSLGNMLFASSSVSTLHIGNSGTSSHEQLDDEHVYSETENASVTDPAENVYETLPTPRPSIDITGLNQSRMDDRQYEELENVRGDMSAMVPAPSIASLHSILGKSASNLAVDASSPGSSPHGSRRTINNDAVTEEASNPDEKRITTYDSVDDPTLIFNTLYAPSKGDNVPTNSNPASTPQTLEELEYSDDEEKRVTLYDDVDDKTMAFNVLYAPMVDEKGPGSNTNQSAPDRSLDICCTSFDVCNDDRSKIVFQFDEKKSRRHKDMANRALPPTPSPYYYVLNPEQGGDSEQADEELPNTHHPTDEMLKSDVGEEVKSDTSMEGQTDSIVPDDVLNCSLKITSDKDMIPNSCKGDPAEEGTESEEVQGVGVNETQPSGDPYYHCLEAEMNDPNEIEGNGSKESIPHDSTEDPVECETSGNIEENQNTGEPFYHCLEHESNEH